MTRKEFEEILRKLQGMSLNEKIAFLEENIEETDYDGNGYNDELRRMLNDLKNKRK